MLTDVQKVLLVLLLGALMTITAHQLPYCCQTSHVFLFNDKRGWCLVSNGSTYDGSVKCELSGYTDFWQIKYTTLKPST